MCVLAGVMALAVSVGLGAALTKGGRGGDDAVSEPYVRPPSPVLLSDREAAERVNRSPSEPRPDNRRANSRVPTAAELARFRRASRGQGVARRVTGRFTGTTGEIIHWAALKWGFDPDLLRAQAVTESSWHQDAVGDGGQSFGLMQIKRTKWRGSHPLTALSTAFNVDLAASILRQAFDGRAPWYRSEGYHAGDLWGSLGSYFSGHWNDAEGRRYVRSVWRQIADRAWEERGF
jgi:soluble lytic murein transglycosylase-like protein